mmetsp:Transcript_121108/g.222736  ORF Transcript_121108/g.222736 Transcript_121108/m.222736 type:complete len:214 (-) Transcript_121108:821-1462(-)
MLLLQGKKSVSALFVLASVCLEVWAVVVSRGVGDVPAADELTATTASSSSESESATTFRRFRGLTAAGGGEGEARPLLGGSASAVCAGAAGGRALGNAGTEAAAGALDVAGARLLSASGALRGLFLALPSEEFTDFSVSTSECQSESSTTLSRYRQWQVSPPFSYLQTILSHRDSLRQATQPDMQIWSSSRTCRRKRLPPGNSTSVPITVIIP